MSKLLFVCGFGSGGTDLTKNLLNAHPYVHLFSELPNLASIVIGGYNSNTVFRNINEAIAFKKLLKKLHPRDDFEKIDYKLATDLLKNDFVGKKVLSLGDVLRRCLSTSDANIWGAKIPIWQIGIISELFPNALFLIVTRDVRDVCLSWRNKWGKDMIWCSAKWAERMQKGLGFASGMSSEKYLVVRFEDFLSATEKTCRKMCEFLKIPFSDRMTKYHLYTKQWDGKRNYGKPIISGNKEKWRNELTRKTVFRIEQTAFDTMKLFGYHPEFATNPKPISRHEKIQGICRDSWAILFVGNRALKNNKFGRRIQTALGILKGLLLRRAQKRQGREQG